MIFMFIRNVKVIGLYRVSGKKSIVFN